MSLVRRSPEAVAERLRQALRPSSRPHSKGVRMDPEAVRARLRQVAQLRRVGEMLAAGGVSRRGA